MTNTQDKVDDMITTIRLDQLISMQVVTNYDNDTTKLDHYNDTLYHDNKAIKTMQYYQEIVDNNLYSKVHLIKIGPHLIKPMQYDL